MIGRKMDVAMEKLLLGLEQAQQAGDIHSERIEGVPGARIIHNVLSRSECAGLEQLVRELHGNDDAEGRAKRRESQLHIPVKVKRKALVPLMDRLSKFLPEAAGPGCEECKLLEISNFLRTYCYEVNDFSTPHFDRSYVVGDGKEDRGSIKEFSAYSVVMYLNDYFQGGCTTFFKEDPMIQASSRGNTPIIADPSALEVAAQVKPRMGSVLVFPHGNHPGCHPNPLHEGSVVESNSKCIIRTDLVFRFSKKKKKKKKKKHDEDGTLTQQEEHQQYQHHQQKRQGHQKKKSKSGSKRPTLIVLSPSQELLKQEMEEIMKSRLGELCPEMANDADGSVSFLAPPGPEGQCDVANVVFWKLFKRQLASQPWSDTDNNATTKKTVRMTSDFGIEREFSRIEFAHALIGSLPKNHSFAFVSVREGESGKILFNSKEYVLGLSKNGFSMCDRCGRFVKSANGGLEWHLKSMHSIESHAQAYETVKKASDALIQVTPQSLISSSFDLLRSDFLAKHRRLDQTVMKTALLNRKTLADAIASGKIKSLGRALDACRSGDLETLRECVQIQGWDPKSVDKNGANGLLWAAGFNNMGVCKYLVEECGVDPVKDIQNAKRGYSGRSALHWAARNGNLEIVCWLIEEKHCPADKESGDGTTPLCLAAWQGHLDVCRYLIETAKANYQVVNSYGCNLAMWCAQGASLEICKYVHDLGVNFNLINDNGQGALHKSAQRGHEAICKWLVEVVQVEEKHFLPNAAEKSTPSQLAYYAGHKELSEYLSR